jgi:NADPH2:quinone reductase
MKVIGLTTFGGPDVLEQYDLPVPEPGPGEVRIRVYAAAVNPTDLTFRTGRNQQAKLLGNREPPFIPGIDAAGVIDELGPDGDGRLTVGEPVVAFVLPAGPHGGAYAQYIVAPSVSVVHTPQRAGFAAAATLLLNGLTAQLALDAVDLTPGQTVAVTGAAGSLGGYVVQLATSAGLRVIADAAPGDRDLVASFGATVVVDRGPGVADAIRAAAPDGVKGLIDAADLHDIVLPAIADGGVIASVRGWDGPAERGITVRPIVAQTAATDTALLQQLVTQVEDGTLTLRVADVLPATEAAEAHRRLAKGGLRGRLVLNFAD